MVGRASEQASAASDASGALEMYQDVDRRYTFPLSGFGNFPEKTIQTMFHRIPASFPFERASRSMLTPGLFFNGFSLVL